MRLTLYIAGALMLLLVASYFHQPLQTYLVRIKSESSHAQPSSAVKTETHATPTQRELADLIKKLPSAAQLRVGMIHTAISPEGNQVLQYDIVAAVAGSGEDHQVSPLALNIPLTNWSDFLRTLLAHECAIIRRDALTNDIEKTRLQISRIVMFVVCPITNKKNQLVGAMFATWSNLDAVPADLGETTQIMRISATKIGLNPTE